MIDNVIAAENCDHTWGRYAVKLDYGDESGKDIVGMSYCHKCNTVTMRPYDGNVFSIVGGTHIED